GQAIERRQRLLLQRARVGDRRDQRFFAAQVFEPAFVVIRRRQFPRELQIGLLVQLERIDMPLRDREKRRDRDARTARRLLDGLVADEIVLEETDDDEVG